MVKMLVKKNLSNNKKLENLAYFKKSKLVRFKKSDLANNIDFSADFLIPKVKNIFIHL